MADAQQQFSLALAALNGGNLKEAERLFKKVLQADKAHVPALNLLTIVLMSAERFSEAEKFIERAVGLNQQSDVSFYNYGIISKRLNKPRQALEQFNKAIERNPSVPDTWNNRGTVFNDLRAYEAAISDFDRAIALNNGYFEAYNNKAKSLAELKRYDEAIAAYDNALSLKPDLTEAWFGRGNVFADIKRHDQAFASYDKALSLKPDLKSAEGARLHAKMLCCDWTSFRAECEHLLDAVRAGKEVSAPFALLAINASAEDQLRCAQVWTQKTHPLLAPASRGPAYNNPKIRIGYLSSDLRNHPVAYLMAGVFDHHDKERFETFAFSMGADDKSAIRGRITGAFSHFIDVGDKNDADIADAIRSHKIDILVDLMGHTKEARTSVLARRPAPIQVNYLGFAGTMGADYIDYIIVDKTLVPLEQRHCYAEKIVYLPDSYMPHDAETRVISDKVFQRADFGLPEGGIVFCCFNNAYKINPDAFQSWMKILKAVDRSVLWLSEPSETAKQNLRKEAEAAGVAPNRLVFAKPLESSAEHLARHKLADLFLDTLPYNAHTTASDALWAGLPVLTQVGETFAGRVAASLLSAVGLPELITQSREAYEALAIELALNSEKLESIKEKLRKNRLTMPLFDTRRFTRHIEAAFETMVRRHKAGSSPDHIEIKAIEP